MKNEKFLTVILLSGLLFTACSKNDDTPEPINEEEVITTMTVTLTPEDNGKAVTLKSRDLDGDGPNPPVITPVSSDLTTGTTYNGVIVFLNETVDPEENVTEEVEKESNEHQIFYTLGGGLGLTTDYSNFDENKNPLGTNFSLTTEETASSGTLTFILRHKPKKPNTGLSDAGGETEFTATFNIIVK